MDLAIEDTLAITMAGDGLGIVEGATIAVEDGRIARVGPSGAVSVDADRVIDGRGSLTMPGFVDVHVHSGLTVLRGLAQDVPEIEWMTRALGPFAAELSTEDAIAGARLGALEALRSGVTTVGEYAGDVERLVAEVYEPMGLRVAATETINAVATPPEDRRADEPYAFEADRGRAGLERAESLFERYADHDRVSPLYGPQALDMVPRSLLEELRDRARDRDRDLHVHVAQGDRERRQLEARYGTGTTAAALLVELGLADDSLLAAHLHGASPQERAELADRGVRLAACPSSIVAIDGIVPPMVEYLEAGGTVGIGTDQAPGPGGHEFVRELRTAALSAKADRSDPTALPAWRVLELATVGGARALGLDERIGTLEPGKRADLITVDLAAVSMTPSLSDPIHTAIPNLVYNGDHSVVETVVVDGRVLFADGRPTTVDPERIRREAQDRAERIARSGAQVWAEAGSATVDAREGGWL